MPEMRKRGGIAERSPNTSRDGGNTHLAYANSAALTYTLDLATHDNDSCALVARLERKNLDGPGYAPKGRHAKKLDIPFYFGQHRQAA